MKNISRLPQTKTKLLNFYILNRYFTFILLFVLAVKSLYATEVHLLSEALPQQLTQNQSTAQQATKLSPLAVEANNYAVVTASALNVRSGPGTKHEILKILLKNTHLTNLNTTNDGWLNVRIPKGIKGWVAQKYVKFYQPAIITEFTNNLYSTAFKSSLEASILHYMKELYLQKQLKRVDKLSIVVQDLTTSALITSIRPRRTVKSASTIKVPILQAFMIQRFSGNIEDPLKFKTQIEEMIRFSSNSSTNTIIQVLGGTEKVQQLLNKTNIYNELKLFELIPEDGRTYRNKISAADLNHIFANIWWQRAIGPEFSLLNNQIASEEILDLLSLPGHAWLKDRIKAGTCFADNQVVNIWDKTGFVKGVNGNAGIVEIDTPHGKKAYTIVMFMERDDHDSISGDASKWFERMSVHMRKISEMTYAYFSLHYNSYNLCGRSLLSQYARRALASSTVSAPF